MFIMPSRLSTVLTCLTVWAHGTRICSPVHGFSLAPTARLVPPSTGTGTSTATSHLSAATLGGDDLNLDWNLEQAQYCASTDACSLEELQSSLAEVLRIESICAKQPEQIGKKNDNKATDYSALCSVVAPDLEVILREKLERAKAITTSKSQSVPAKIMTGTLMSAVAMLLLFHFFGVSPHDPSAVPFTLQEWWWAARDGYLPGMLSEYARHGGLAVVDADPDTISLSVSPLTWQEWSWALRDGYFFDALSQTMQQGGLLQDVVPGSSSSSSNILAVAPQEYWWAIQGNYVDTLVSHIAKAGGLQGDGEVSSLTAQEWMWAARDGYLSNLVQEWYQHGGLNL